VDSDYHIVLRADRDISLHSTNQTCVQFARQKVGSAIERKRSDDSGVGDMKIPLCLRWFLLGSIVTLVECHLGSAAEKWVIPKGYVGWLRLDYSVKGSPELPIEHGFSLVRIPQSGRMQTSSLTTASLDSNEYYYEDSHGSHRLVFSWPKVEGYAIQSVYRERKVDARSAGPVRFQFECVFVGTPLDFKDKGDCSAWEVGVPKPPPYRKNWMP
jgi:hypothetical protein